MNTYIVLLRGINVGGKNLLLMKELKALLENGGLENVRTYIQSGNIVLQSGFSPQAKVAEVVESEFGFSLDVLALSKDEFDRSVENNPYKEIEGKFVHFFYCKSIPKPDSEKLASLACPTETYRLIDKVFYLHAPDGIGRSKLAANAERCLGVAATARNLNTINKLCGMISND